MVKVGVEHPVCAGEQWADVVGGQDDTPISNLGPRLYMHCGYALGPDRTGPAFTAHYIITRSAVSQHSPSGRR